MNSKKVNSTDPVKSSKNDIKFLESLQQVIVTKDELKNLYELELNDFVTTVSILAMKAMIDSEIEHLCGKQHSRSSEKPCYRHGAQKTGYVIANGQKHKFKKPRVVTRDKKKDVPLETYKKFQNNIEKSVLAKMMHGVSTRNYRAAAEAIREGYGVEKSSISRHYVKASAKMLQEFNERSIDQYFPIIYVDGYEIGGDMMLVALGIAENGNKTVLSLRQGGTENEEVVKSMFDDMERRGVKKDQPILFVIDGAKAIKSAIKKRFEKYFIQRCREHKKRNIIDHAPERMKDEVERRVNEAYAEQDYEKARAQLNSFAKWADKINPDMGNSIREGLEDTLTVIRLEVPPFLYKTVYSTNPIESLNSSFANFTRRVKNWRGGDMKKRWLAASIVDAEKRMYKVRGAMSIPILIKNMNAILEINEKLIDRKTS